ncbi:MAG TPA: DUF3365 domain-containing protein, partial [Schlesneria sp.]
MRLVLAMFAAVMCLSLVVYLRDPERPLPLSIPAAGPIPEVGPKLSHRQPKPVARSIRNSMLPTPVAKLVHFNSTNDDHFCIGEIPPKAQELVAVLEHLHVTTVHAFEHAPAAMGSVGRAGGGFGGSSGNHSRYPGERWPWNPSQEVTSRGFVYQAKGRQFVGKRELPVTRSYYHQTISKDPVAEVGHQERVWDIVDVHLVDLLMHQQPVVYEELHEVKAREPDSFETEALKTLRGGAERVMEWDDEFDCLRVIGAIRAKESCLKCHDVKTGQMVGA